MSFTFHCPFCNQELEAEENWIGQEAACPNCSKTIKIIKNSENSVFKICIQMKLVVPTVVPQSRRRPKFADSATKS